MPPKLQHKDVERYYKDHGYILTSIYKNCMSKDELICPSEHKITMTFNDFKYDNCRCSVCAGKAKHTHDWIFNEYKKEGYTLISIYKNCMSKDELICPLNHKVNMRFNDFQQKHRCLECSKKIIGNKLRYDPDLVFNYYKKEGYTLDSEYKNSKIRNQLICPRNHKCEISYYKFKNLGQRCKICNAIDKAEHNNSNLYDDRRRRSQYLQFNLKNINILNDDPLYNCYLQSKLFTNNRNKPRYTVDHIYPRIAFIDNNLDNIYNKWVIKNICNSRENLRIISAKENGSKGSQYIQEEFMNWFNSKI